MSKPWRQSAGRVLLKLAAFAALLALAAVPARNAGAEELQGLLEDVTAQYARAYLSPLLYALGPDLNSGLYNTAAIAQSGLSIQIGVVGAAMHLAETDQTFQKVIPNVDLGDYDADFDGVTGDIVMSGPTVFGDTDTAGSVAGYVAGVQVFNQETIEGLIKSRYAPVALPQASIGGISGFRGTVRWLPEMDLGDLGKTKVFGWGLQWNANGLMPTLPFDAMVGFFRQSLDIGTLVEVDANSMFVAVSKPFSLATVYGGYTKEDSEVSIAYTYSGDGSDVAFTVDDTQGSHFTVGATLNVLAKLNVEMNHGDVTTYAAGLMFGF